METNSDNREQDSEMRSEERRGRNVDLCKSESHWAENGKMSAAFAIQFFEEELDV